MAGPGFEYIGKEEEKLLLKVIRSRQLNRYYFDTLDGERKSFVIKFEKNFSNFINTNYAIAMNSCTSALISAMKALSIGSGDEVIVPGYTFVATVAAVKLVGAKPIFCDIDESLTIDPERLNLFYSSKTKAIICVHMLGRPCQMDKILKYAKSKKLFVIEDVAQACGASFKGKKLGSFGEIGCFSFNIFKVITAGDGGALVTSLPDAYERAYAYHDHGFVPGRVRLIDADSIIGMNLRMTELSAAVLLAQLDKIKKITYDIKLRNKLIQKYLKLPSYIKKFVSNDQHGEIGSAIVIGFNTETMAKKASLLLKTKVLADSGRHYYKNMFSILGQEKPFAEESPLRKPLKQTDDILSRSVMIGVGVLDNYLGAGLGLKARSPIGQARVLANNINNILKNLQ